MTCAACGAWFWPHSRTSRYPGHEIVWRSRTSEGDGPFPWRLLHIP